MPRVLASMPALRIVLVLFGVAIVALPTAAVLGPSHTSIRLSPGAKVGSASPAVSTLAAASASLARLSTGISITGPESSGWANVTADSHSLPPPRSYGRMMAWDPVDGYVVLFGGDGSAGYMNDTWTFSQAAWKQLHPARAPSDRDHGTLTWDAADGYLLLFGGSGNSGTYTDTWKFLHGNWTQLYPKSHPSGRWASQMTYDASDGYVLLFGGCAGSAVNDSWKYVNGTWTQLYPAKSPPQTTDANLVYDPTDGYVVLFGGQINWGTSISNETWTFHGGNWTQLNPRLSPEARYEASMAYDNILGKIVLFGGADASYTSLGDTWQFSGGVWTLAQLTNAPAARYFGELSNYSGTVVLFGGAGSVGTLDDTWLYYAMNATATVTTLSGDAPLTVGFSASSSGGTGTVTYSWTYGDLDSSSNGMATHVYSAVGFYIAQLTAVDAFGVEATAQVGITVHEPLTAFAVASPTSGPAPLNVSLDAGILGGILPYSASWSLDGAPIATGDAAQISLTTVGVHVVTFTASDAGGGHQTWTQNLTVLPSIPRPLFSSASASSSVGDVPLSVSFSSSGLDGTPPYTYAWQFGDGGTATTPSPTHVFLESGVFQATVVVTDSRGLTSSSSVNVTAWAQLGARIAPPGYEPAGTGLSFTGTPSGGLPPYRYAWEFGDGVTAATAFVTHAYAVAGTYDANLTVYDSTGANSTTSVVVTVGPAVPVSSTQPSHAASNGADLASYEVIVAEVGAAAVAVALVIALAFRKRE